MEEKNNNFEIIRNFLTINGEATELVCKDPNNNVSVYVRTLDIDEFATITRNGEQLLISRPTITYCERMNGDYEFTFDATNLTYGAVVKDIKIDEHYAEIFADAIKKGYVFPITMKQVVVE